MIKRGISWTAVVALAATLAATGYWLLFTTFKGYDDEGYVLLSLKNFSLHGSLYDRVYTQYGPFPYLLYDALHRLLGFAYTNTSGRWITLVNWLGTAAVCAGLVARQTRSVPWAAFTLAGVFTYLFVMIREPIHPGGLLSLLVAVGVWLGAGAWSAGRPGRFAVLAALTGAALVLTKVNVGVFFLGAAFAWLAVNTQSPRAARTLAWLVAAGCAVLPFGLMHTLFAAPWVRLFGLVFAGGALAALFAARAVARLAVTPRIWAWFAGTLAGAGLLLGALTLARGTSLRGLIDGVLLSPLKQPTVYFIPMPWEAGTGALALASLLLAGWSVHAGWLPRPGFRHAIAATRLAATAFFLCAPLQLIPASLVTWGVSYGVTLAWLFVVPLREEAEGAAVRAWVALVLIFQLLHAYPVAGSQLNWGTYLWVPLLALGMHDAGPLIRSWLGRRAGILALAGTLAIAAVTVVMTGQLAKIGWYWYQQKGNPRLEIPGAENLRLDGEQTYVLRIMNENLRAQADLLFSLPGLYSANLWTDLPTPTLANATHWFSLLSEAQQQEIIARLGAAPRSAVLVERNLLDFLIGTGFPPHGTLYEWLLANYDPAFTLDGYELWVRHGRRIAALSTARYRIVDENQRELTLTLAAPARPVARIELCDDNAPGQPLVTLPGKDTTVDLEPIDLAGAATGAVQRVSFPFTYSGCARVTLHYTKTGARIPYGRALLVLRDGTGAIVGEARVLN